MEQKAYNIIVVADGGQSTGRREEGFIRRLHEKDTGRSVRAIASAHYAARARPRGTEPLDEEVTGYK